MSAIENLQHRFQEFVMTGGAGIERAVIDGPRVGVDVRLAIYANAYRSRLAEVLEADYPALKVLVGDDRFKEIAHAYLAAYPSQTPNARWFGRHLLSFLMNHPSYAGQTVLAEMASFEWAMSLAFDAADEPVLTVAHLAQVPGEQWPDLRFALQASLQRLELMWNVPAFWQATHEGAAPSAPQQAEEASPWIVWRRDLVTYYRSLEADEVWMLRAACDGKTFGDMCEGLALWHDADAVPARAIELLKRWTEESLIRGCSRE